MFPRTARKGLSLQWLSDVYRHGVANTARLRAYLEQVRFIRIGYFILTIIHAWWFSPMRTLSTVHMMTTSNWDIFRVTGCLWGALTGDQWIPLTKASDVELWYFYIRLNKRLSKQSRLWWFDTPSRPLWCHCNVKLLEWRIPQTGAWITKKFPR